MSCYLKLNQFGLYRQDIFIIIYGIGNFNEFVNSFECQNIFEMLFLDFKQIIFDLFFKLVFIKYIYLNLFMFKYW